MDKTFYSRSLFLVITIFGVITPTIGNTNNQAPKFEDIKSQIIDLAPTETNIPKSLKEQLSHQYKIVLLKVKKGQANYSTGQANLESIKPERGHESYVNFNPSNMNFSSHKIDLNNDQRSELEVTYVGLEAAAINWPLWIFSIQGGNYIPILKASVGTYGYFTLQSINHGYHDIVTTKTIIDDPNAGTKNEYTIYKFDGFKYIINSRLIEILKQSE